VWSDSCGVVHAPLVSSCHLRCGPRQAFAASALSLLRLPACLLLAGLWVNTDPRGMLHTPSCLVRPYLLYTVVHAPDRPCSERHRRNQCGSRAGSRVSDCGHPGSPGLRHSAGAPSAWESRSVGRASCLSECSLQQASYLFFLAYPHPGAGRGCTPVAHLGVG